VEVSVSKGIVQDRLGLKINKPKHLESLNY